MNALVCVHVGYTYMVDVGVVFVRVYVETVLNENGLRGGGPGSLRRRGGKGPGRPSGPFVRSPQSWN